MKGEGGEEKERELFEKNLLWKMGKTRGFTSNQKTRRERKNRPIQKGTEEEGRKGKPWDIF